MQILTKICLSILILLLNFNVSAADQSTDKMLNPNRATNAVWQEHQTRFHLSSFYDYYSCDGMESKVETLLTELGAREVKARVSGCFEANGQLGNSLTIRVKYQTLSSDTSLVGESVTANLQNVHIKPRHPRSVALGDCLLISKLQDNVLNNFEHEVIKRTVNATLAHGP